jgi:8-oxo-dGTP diphosphatase
VSAAREDDHPPRGGVVGSSERQVRVAAYAVCRSNGRLLLVRASAMTEVHGAWFLPGGGLDFGEDPSDCVLRELREETGLHGSEPVLFDVVTDVRVRRSGETVFSVRLIYLIDECTGELSSEQHGTTDEARWVPFDELDALELTPYVVRVLALASAK